MALTATELGPMEGGRLVRVDRRGSDGIIHLTRIFRVPTRDARLAVSATGVPRYGDADDVIPHVRAVAIDTHYKTDSIYVTVEYTNEEQTETQTGVPGEYVEISRMSLVRETAKVTPNNVPIGQGDEGYDILVPHEIRTITCWYGPEGGEYPRPSIANLRRIRGAVNWAPWRDSDKFLTDMELSNPYKGPYPYPCEDMPGDSETGSWCWLCRSVRPRKISERLFEVEYEFEMNPSPTGWQLEWMHKDVNGFDEATGDAPPTIVTELPEGVLGEIKAKYADIWDDMTHQRNNNLFILNIVYPRFVEDFSGIFP